MHGSLPWLCSIAAAVHMTEVRHTPLKGNCLYATRDFAAGAAVTDERPLVRSRLDDDAALTERVEAAHRRSPFGFQHMRSHLAALWTLQSAPPHVIDAVAATFDDAAFGAVFEVFVVVRFFAAASFPCAAFFLDTVAFTIARFAGALKPDVKIADSCLQFF